MRGIILAGNSNQAKPIINLHQRSSTIQAPQKMAGAEDQRPNPSTCVGCVLCQQHAPTKRSACVQSKQPIINFILHILINLLVRIYVRRDRLPYTLKIHIS
eukprot:scaffold13805_cov23-Cyclotella_meneghiniana.AAC.2